MDRTQFENDVMEKVAAKLANALPNMAKAVGNVKKIWKPGIFERGWNAAKPVLNKATDAAGKAWKGSRRVVSDIGDMAASFPYKPGATEGSGGLRGLAEKFLSFNPPPGAANARNQLMGPLKARDNMGTLGGLLGAVSAGSPFASMGLASGLGLAALPFGLGPTGFLAASLGSMGAGAAVGSKLWSKLPSPFIRTATEAAKPFASAAEQFPTSVAPKLWKAGKLGGSAFYNTLALPTLYKLMGVAGGAGLGGVAGGFASPFLGPLAIPAGMAMGAGIGGFGGGGYGKLKGLQRLLRDTKGYWGVPKGY